MLSDSNHWPCDCRTRTLSTALKEACEIRKITDLKDAARLLGSSPQKWIPCPGFDCQGIDWWSDPSSLPTTRPRISKVVPSPNRAKRGYGEIVVLNSPILICPLKCLWMGEQGLKFMSDSFIVCFLLLNDCSTRPNMAFFAVLRKRWKFVFYNQVTCYKGF